MAATGWRSPAPRFGGSLSTPGGGQSGQRLGKKTLQESWWLRCGLQGNSTDVQPAHDPGKNLEGRVVRRSWERPGVVAALARAGSYWWAGCWAGRPGPARTHRPG